MKDLAKDLVSFATELGSGADSTRPFVPEADRSGCGCETCKRVLSEGDLEDILAGFQKRPKEEMDRAERKEQLEKDKKEKEKRKKEQRRSRRKQSSRSREKNREKKKKRDKNRRTRLQRQGDRKRKLKRKGVH